MSRSRAILVLILASVTLAWGARSLRAQTGPAPESYTTDKAPEPLQPAIARGQAAAKALQARLQTRLVELLPKGPAGALDVCRREAYAIAADISLQQGFSMGRTSHKLRNPQNAPKPWAAAIVAANAGKKAADVKAWAVDLGDQVGVLQPIPMGEACALCHATPSWMPKEVADAIKQGYPNDQATGFKPGDLRGWIWVEVPKG